MKHLFRNGIILLFVLGFAVYSIIPPDEQLRKGKDLAGGATLLYAVDVRPGDQGDVIGKVITVVKERLDPTGVMEISVVQQGDDQIEITMPIPSEAVKQLRVDFENALSQIESRGVTGRQIDNILALPPDERDAAFERAAGDDVEQLERYQELVTVYEQYQEVREDYEQLRDETVPALESLVDTLLETIDPGDRETDQTLIRAREQLADARDRLEDLPSRVALRQLQFEEARERAIGTPLTPEEITRALRLSDEPLRLKNEDTGEMQVESSPREVALERIKSEHPGVEEQIDEVVEAWDTYQSQRRTLDDPSDVVRLLRDAGILTFRITVSLGERDDEQELRQRLRDLGPRNAAADDAAWFQIHDIRGWVDTVQDLEDLRADPASYFARSSGLVVEEFGGEYYVLCWDNRGNRLTPEEGNWALQRAFPSQDQRGFPAISFQMDRAGAQKLGNLTQANVGRNMAVLLDDKVYTAPTLRSRISRDGQITGRFTSEEIQYIVRVLNSGSLQAKLGAEPISINVYGPQLGQDNLEKGLSAGVIAFALVAGFMIFYYFSYGVVAVTALLMNAVLLLGAMALNRAAFTLPGIAGVILTFGIAVDANVLIYERIREEILKGHDLRKSVRLGYDKALSAIVDGNVTTLIVCVMLGIFATQEIKGFAITLGIGIVTTLFSQLFFTRWLFAVMVDSLRVRAPFRLMLPTAVPFVQRLLEPKVDWLKLRGFALAFSILFVGFGVTMIVIDNKDLLGTEFRGGTEVAIQFKDWGDDPNRPDDKSPDDPMTMTRAEVESVVQEIGRSDGLLGALEQATIIAVEPEDDGITSSHFKIRTTLQNADDVQAAIAQAFRDRLDIKPPISFSGERNTNAADAPVFPVLSPILGENINRPESNAQVRGYLGGAAILLEDMSPAVPLEDLEARIELMRRNAYSDTLSRQRELFVLEGTDDAVRAAVLVVADEDAGFFDNEGRWRSEVRDREWSLVRDALTETQTLASVQSFSSAVAAGFLANAVIAVILSTVMILIYVWVRFGSPRYSIAAIATVLHDCLIAVGLVALADLLYANAPALSSTLGLLPFKINLALVSAILMILGYSLNDTIVVMDRIRENRGKLPYASRAVVNLSINQTFSRTVVTSGTTLAAIITLYVAGGEGIREFAYIMLCGILVGTYSSIAVAAPLVWNKRADPHARDDDPAPAPEDPRTVLSAS